MQAVQPEQEGRDSRGALHPAHDRLQFGRERFSAEELERTEARRQIHTCLDRLKPLDRSTLEAFYLRGRTLKQMSRRTGLSISLLSQIERAESSPSISSLYKIAVALDSKIHDLFGNN